MKISRQAIIRILALLLVIGITVLILLFRDRVKDLGALGYPGLFLVSILANATVIIPVPGVVLTSAMAAVFDPFWVAVATGSGAAIGELTGYLAGFSGQPIVQNARLYDRLAGWMKKYGDLTILVLAFLPNPAFDMAGIVSGMLKVPLWRFLLWCWVGKVIKMMAFAYFGASLFALFV